MGQIRKRQNSKYWQIRYYRNGVRQEESSYSTRRSDAERLLKQREGAVAQGIPVSAKIGQLRYDEAAEDVLTDYRVNGRRSLPDASRRHEKHLKPFFGGSRMSSIATPDVRLYTSRRLDAGASRGEINRELTFLKRTFSLAIQAGKLFTKPHVPLLQENNIRRGFFEAAELAAVLRHLPRELEMLVRFLSTTGWRVGEVLALEWRQVDLDAAEIRLDPGMTKNRQGRTFPFTDELREILEHQLAVTDELKRTKGIISPWVFSRNNGRPIRSFRVAWKNACVKAGCPGRLVHDLRRTAVRNMVRSGISEPVAMRLTGHKTRSVFDRYNIVSDGDLRASAIRLNEVRRERQA